MLLPMYNLLDNDIYWSPDKVHFSNLGYDKIGDIVFENIAEMAKSKLNITKANI
jgi:lysophospholipase L1-like esterase